MTQFLVIVTTAALILLAPEPKAEAQAPEATRIDYATGMRNLFGPICEQACAGYPEECMVRCMGPQLATADKDYENDEAACDAHGGIIVARMPTCQVALERMLELDADSEMTAALDVVQDIYHTCSVDALCMGLDGNESGKGGRF